MQAVKIDDGWMSMFSDSFKGGYYRFTKNTFALTLGLLSLAVAYVFSIFIIVTAILELAFKRVLGVLVLQQILRQDSVQKLFYQIFYSAI